MVTEIAYITIDPAKADAFVAAVGEAASLFRAAKGCHGMRLEQVYEDRAEFRLIVDWESVDHHMVIFRGSEGFQHWRALAGPFFAQPPRVEHWDRVNDLF